MAILYVVGRSFLCRPCGSLVYESQQQDRLTRLEDKARRIRLRLGGDTALNTPFPAKPKRMHWRTYERLRQEGEGAEYALLVALGEKLQHLQQKMDKLALRSACMPT
ncbi:MAG: hypothetical protein HY268_05970 [Deltaproteobacteria bacterium]|nr:hypothetical protein [Deltaproteobacteria bacterium]